MISADGEFQASARLADAARGMAATPGALQLRLLQTVVDLAAEKNRTLVMPFPEELLRFFARTAEVTGAAAVDVADESPTSSPAPPRTPPVGTSHLRAAPVTSNGQAH